MTRVTTKTRVRMTPDRVRRAAHKARITGIRHAAAVLRLEARKLIRKGKKASRPGSAPHTRAGALRRSILFEASDTTALIGPAAQFVGPSASAHEHGGRYKARRYPKRPFMAPALDSLRPRLPRFWAATLK